jgi:tetratricopeptide (TPR) repeat protein
MTAAVDQTVPYDAATSLMFAAILRAYMRDYAHGEPLAVRALAESEKHQFQLVLALCQCSLGHIRAQLGHVSEGIGLIRRGVTGELKAGGSGFTGYFMTCLAWALAKQGAIGEAYDTIEQAFAINSEELVHRPESFRIRGEIRLKREQTEQAEIDFRESIALALSMGAKAWELRSTMSLARLLNQQGRRDEARKLLTESYNWFTEGFDTPDLKDAKTLLTNVLEQRR